MKRYAVSLHTIHDMLPGLVAAAKEPAWIGFIPSATVQRLRQRLSLRRAGIRWNLEQQHLAPGSRTPRSILDQAHRAAGWVGSIPPAARVKATLFSFNLPLKCGEDLPVVAGELWAVSCLRGPAGAAVCHSGGADDLLVAGQLEVCVPGVARSNTHRRHPVLCQQEWDKSGLPVKSHFFSLDGHPERTPGRCAAIRSVCVC